MSIYLFFDLTHLEAMAEIFKNFGVFFGRFEDAEILLRVADLMESHIYLTSYIFSIKFTSKTYFIR